MNYRLFQNSSYVVALFLILCFLFTPCYVSALCVWNCVPIDVNFRDDARGVGLTARLHNTSKKHLAVNIFINNKTTYESRHITLAFKPNETIDLGATASPELYWQFMSGETIEISHHDYNPVVTKVP